MSILFSRDRIVAPKRKNASRVGGLAISLTLTTFLLFSAASAIAAPPTLNWGAQINGSSCDKSRRPVVNVTHKVINSVDSGTAGNFWAFVNYNKRIRFWDQGDGTYCAVVSYLGKFAGVDGEQSPGNTEPLDGDERGTFQGGYRITITGDLRESATWPTRGRIGVIDYDCDIAGDCPGSVNWLGQYFQSSSYKYDWWGWTYKGGRHGTWVNSSDGNAGDIT